MESRCLLCVGVERSESISYMTAVLAFAFVFDDFPVSHIVVVVNGGNDGGCSARSLVGLCYA